MHGPPSHAHRSCDSPPIRRVQNDLPGSNLTRNSEAHKWGVFFKIWPQTGESIAPHLSHGLPLLVGVQSSTFYLSKVARFVLTYLDGCRSPPFFAVPWSRPHPTFDSSPSHSKGTPPSPLPFFRLVLIEVFSFPRHEETCAHSGNAAEEDIPVRIPRCRLNSIRYVRFLFMR
jgi:hypothetical protein